MSKKVNTIVFDLGNVLLDLDFEKCVNAFKQIGYKTVDIDLENKDSSTWETIRAFESGKISSNEFRSKIRQTIGDKDLTDQAIDQAWNSMLGEISPENLELLVNLDEYYELYLLSNTNEIHQKYFETKYNLSKLFKKTFYSFELGLAKPASDIFEQMISKTQLNPEETLFIDDLAENVQTAKSIGFTAFQFDKNKLSLVQLLKLF